MKHEDSQHGKPGEFRDLTFDELAALPNSGGDRLGECVVCYKQGQVWVDRGCQWEYCRSCLRAIVEKRRRLQK